MHIGWIIIICWQLDIPRISGVVIWFLRIVIFYSDLDTKKSFFVVLNCFDLVKTGLFFGFLIVNLGFQKKVETNIQKLWNGLVKFNYGIVLSLYRNRTQFKIIQAAGMFFKIERKLERWIILKSSASNFWSLQGTNFGKFHFQIMQKITFGRKVLKSHS